MEKEMTIDYDTETPIVELAMAIHSAGQGANAVHNLLLDIDKGIPKKQSKWAQRADMLRTIADWARARDMLMRLDKATPEEREQMLAPRPDLDYRELGKEVYGVEGAFNG